MATDSRLTTSQATRTTADGSCRRGFERTHTGGDRHEQAEALVRGFDSGALPTAHVTNYVLLESLNWIHERKRHDIAVDLRRRLTDSAGFDLVHSAQKDYHRAVDLFDDHEQLAFGDATIAAYMDRTGIEYLDSFDDDFDQLG